MKINIILIGETFKIELSHMEECDVHFFLKKNNRKMRFYKELGSYKIIGKVSFDEVEELVKILAREHE